MKSNNLCMSRKTLEKAASCLMFCGISGIKERNIFQKLNPKGVKFVAYSRLSRERISYKVDVCDFQKCLDNQYQM